MGLSSVASAQTATPAQPEARPAPLPAPVQLPAAAVAWAKGAQTSAAGERFGILIAADVYERHAEWQLPGAGASVAAVREALVRHAGFASASITVLGGREVHLEAVRSAVLAAGERVAAGSEGVLYLHWLGHGWVQNGEQMLFGHYTDEVAGSFAPAIARRDLLAWLGQAQERAKIRGAKLTPVLVVDACRVARGAPPPKAKLVQSTAFEVYGAKDGEMVAAGQGGEGFTFTGALVAAMTALAPRGEVALDVVFREARDRTLRNSGQRQEPMWLAPAQAVAPSFLQPPKLTFALRLVDGTSGARVEAAKLLVDDAAQAVTQARAVLRLAPGDHVLAVQAPGYLPRFESLSLTAAQADAELTLPLLPELVVVRGRLVPPGVLGVRVKSAAPARPDYHALSATSDRDGRFELRLPSLAGAVLDVMQQARVLQSLPLPAVANALVRDAAGVHDSVPVLDLVVALEGAALAATQLAPDVQWHDAQAPAQEPELASDLDRADWLRAKAALARGQLDQARDALLAMPRTPALQPWLRYVEQRWAREILERALRNGPTTGDWAGVDAVGGWLLVALFADKEHYPRALRELFDRVTDERISPRSRSLWNAANAALAAGELEGAVANYLDALDGATPHYQARIAAQVEQLRTRLYARHMNAGAERESSGDPRGALAAYASALRWSLRARPAVARLCRDAQLAALPQAVALLSLVDKSFEDKLTDDGAPLLDQQTWDALDLAGLPSTPLPETAPNSTSIWDELRVKSTRERRDELAAQFQAVVAAQAEVRAALVELQAATGATSTVKARAVAAAKLATAAERLAPLAEQADTFHAHHASDVEHHPNETVRQTGKAAVAKLQATTAQARQALAEAEAEARQIVDVLVIARPDAAKWQAALAAIDRAATSAGEAATALARR